MNEIIKPIATNLETLGENKNPELSNENIIVLYDQIKQDLIDSKTVQPFLYYEEQLRDLGILITEEEYITAVFDQMQVEFRMVGNLHTAANMLSVVGAHTFDTYPQKQRVAIIGDFMKAITASGTHLSDRRNNWQPLEVEAAFALRASFGEYIDDEAFAKALAWRAASDLSDITEIELEAGAELTDEMEDSKALSGEILNPSRRIDADDTTTLKQLFRSHGRSAISALAAAVSEYGIDEPFYTHLQAARESIMQQRIPGYSTAGTPQIESDY